MLYDQLSVPRLLDDIRVRIVLSQRRGEKEALLRCESVIRCERAFDSVHDDGNVCFSVEDHDLVVKENGGADKNEVREERTHVADIVVVVFVAEPQTSLLGILVYAFEFLAEVGRLLFRAVSLHQLLVTILLKS